MKKKGLALMITGFLAVGTITGFVYASNNTPDTGNEVS